jgi:translation initiation factor IF-2
MGVTSKDVLNKCKAEGVDVKNHMTALSAGLEATIREWFSEEGDQHTAVETAEHVDIEKAKEKARKSRRRRSKQQQEDQAVAEALEQAEQETAETEQEQEPSAEEPQTEATEPTVEEPKPQTEPVATDEKPQPSAEAEEPAPEPKPATPTPTEKPLTPAAKSEEPADEEPADEAPTEDEPKQDEDVAPAGPQVVPKPAKLKGPRVVRVEKPDYIPRPQSRQAPAPPTPGLRSPGSRNLKDEREVIEDRKAKKSRRNPRRRGGRGSDAGERIKEWRNTDLAERAESLRAAGGGLRRRRPNMGGGGKRKRSPSAPGSGIKTGEVEVQEPITIKTLSAETGIKAADIIKKLMTMGTMATINQVIDTEMAEAICAEYDIELVVARDTTAEEALLATLAQREPTDMTQRAPVVTFLGHVDHGKTSLLDKIRSTSVADGEAGGITQAIGAHKYEVGNKHVVFLDTPGHEAFTAMRARGANMTDVVVLVVAADDGVMPQTVEAINHAKAAKVPIVVALNKIDVPNANIQKAMGQLAEHDLQPQEWGGQTEVIKTSAMTGEGVEELMELLSLEAEILELKAETDAPASGYVVEARMDPGKGVLATLLNVNGTLRIGDTVLAGRGVGRVRQLYDDKGNALEQAGPATPVVVMGLDEVPEAGDKFYAVEDVDAARAVAEERRTQSRAVELGRMTKAPRTLQELIGQIEAGQANELPIILKADVQGSIEAIVGSLEKIGSEETRLNILHAGVGGISTGDVTLAEASGAIIIGFNVVADPQARRMAEEQKVDIRLYRVIYSLIEDLTKALEEGLEPEIREEQLGQAEVRQTFKISRLGTIAGCYVTEGVAQRNAKVRLIRDNVVIEDERELDSLKRVKDDAREVKAGLECGLKIKGFDDIKEGDIIEFYKEVEVARTLGG